MGSTQSTWGKHTANMQLTASQFDTVYNVTSFGLACMMASTTFFFLRLGSMTERYQEALCYTGLVTFIAFYHYYRIFNSFDSAFTPCEVVDGVVNAAKCDPETAQASLTGSIKGTSCSIPAVPAQHTTVQVSVNGQDWSAGYGTMVQVVSSMNVSSVEPAVVSVLG